MADRTLTVRHAETLVMLEIPFPLAVVHSGMTMAARAEAIQLSAELGNFVSQVSILRLQLAYISLLCVPCTPHLLPPSIF
jgi:hypothetical protein